LPASDRLGDGGDGAIGRVGVLGCGQMGSGIAEVCARAGLEVLVGEVDGDALRAGRSRIERSLERAARAGKLGEDERAGVLERLAFTTELASFAGCDLVVEAVAEDAALKRELFAALDRLVAPDAVLASNTSSIPIASLAAATTRPERVVGLHFFNPVPVMPLVELTKSLLTADAVAAAAEHFVLGRLGKQVIRARDQAGFIVNGLLVPYLLGAIRMLETGAASAEDIDRGMELGCAHPMGPLRLADFIGLDTLLAIAETLHAEYGEPSLAPSALLRRMVEVGRLGRKAGQGFYRYEAPAGGAGTGGG